MAELKSTVAAAALIGVLTLAFWYPWRDLGVADSVVIELVVPFVAALVVAFGVSVAYYAVRARMRSR
jgi:hypothetical protein